MAYFPFKGDAGPVRSRHSNMAVGEGGSWKYFYGRPEGHMIQLRAVLLELRTAVRVLVLDYTFFFLFLNRPDSKFS